ncbi:yellow-h [Nomia melanderi]|uniref:yellow-h n=1 Tax=Nomia melanderi TaxID=2448451 RepID=UPI003FCD3C38
MFASWLLAFCFGAISLENRMQVTSLELRNHALSVVLQWKYLDYAYESEEQRDTLLRNGGYIAKNNIPIDIDVAPDGRKFVTVVRAKGVPSSLNVVSSKHGDGGPLLAPYPDWSWTKTDCSGIISVFRVQIIGNILYVLDNGKIGTDTVCPPKLFIFNLATDRLMKCMTIPKELATNSTSGQGLLITPIIKPHGHPLYFDAILADVTGYALVIYSPHTGWNRMVSSALNYDPKMVDYTINGETFQLEDGPLGLALSHKTGMLYLSPMSSRNMVSVNSHQLVHSHHTVHFYEYKDILPTQSSAKAMSLSQILFFGLTNNQIACWNENRPMTKENMPVIAESSELLQFTSGMKVKRRRISWSCHEEELWIMTNRYQKAALDTLDTSEVNFRVLKGSVRELTAGTRCDSYLSLSPSCCHTDAMTGKKRSLETETGSYGRQRNQWSPLKTPKPSNGYVYHSPTHSFLYNWDEPNTLRYNHDCLQRKWLKHKQTSGTGMANVLPWLMSMCLLGAQEFASPAGSHALSRDLETPGSRSVSPGFRSSLRNYKTLIATHDELPGHINCPDHGDVATTLESSVDRQLPTTPEYSNYLYGSTPHSGAYFFPSSFERSRDRSRPIGRNPSVLKTDPYSVNQLDTHVFNYDPGRGHLEDDYVGPAMELVYAWSTVDYTYDSVEARDAAIYDGDFIAENNLPLGLDVWREKVFITLPKWKNGIPATLATVPRHSKTRSPKLRPYPDWSWHQTGSCDGLTSVFRVQVDECDRLWVLDSGKTEVSSGGKATCPPAIFIFDLLTDSLIRKYVFPDDQVKQDSLYTNIVVDIRNEDCGSAVAYASDVFRYGLLVYDFMQDSSFRIQHHLFFPDPLASKYDHHGIKFQWTDGIFAIALGPVDTNDDRTLFFHPLSSFREFAVPTSVLKDKRSAENYTDAFMPIGLPRAKDYGHSSGSVVDRNGVMFFNMVTRDSVWCWDTRKEYIPQNLGVIGTSNLSLVFPNDIKVDHQYDQSVWVLSNSLAMYLYGSIDNSKVNYRVFKANIKEAIKDTICDPNYIVHSFGHGYDDTC